MKRFLIYILLLVSVSAMAQKERSTARKGNRFYTDSAYTEAEVAYMKALDINPELREAQYNLANAAIRQQKFDEALEQLNVLAETSEDKVEKAEIYHNMGNALLSKFDLASQDQQQAKDAGKILDQSIDAFKKSLRLNPADDETRYNLAVAQKLKDEQQQQQQQNQQQQNQEQQQNEQEKEDKEEEKEQEQNQDQQEQQQQQQQEQQQNPNEISKEDAEKILNAMMQEEKELQEKQKEKQKANAHGRQVEKDW